VYAVGGGGGLEDREEMVVARRSGRTKALPRLDLRKEAVISAENKGNAGVLSDSSPGSYFLYLSFLFIVIADLRKYRKIDEFAISTTFFLSTAMSIVCLLLFFFIFDRG
jgi:hypothetical protein